MAVIDAKQVQTTGKTIKANNMIGKDIRPGDGILNQTELNIAQNSYINEAHYAAVKQKLDPENYPLSNYEKQRGENMFFSQDKMKSYLHPNSIPLASN